MGVVSYLPREAILKEDELLGAVSPYANEIESDLEDHEDDVNSDTEKQIFNREVQETMESCIKTKVSHSNMMTEVKNLKMTENMSYSDCIEAIIPVILDLVNK